MPSKDSFSDSRYGQSYEHDHEDHYDHDTGYNSYLNTGMNFGNLSTGSLIDVLKKIPNPDETATELIEQHKTLTQDDFKNHSDAYKDFVKKAKPYVRAHTKKAAKQPSLYDVVTNLSKTHPVLNGFLQDNKYEEYKARGDTRKWNSLAKKFCEGKVTLPPKPERHTTKAKFKDFIVREHKSQNGKTYLTIIPKVHHEHDHKK